MKNSLADGRQTLAGPDAIQTAPPSLVPIGLTDVAI